MITVIQAAEGNAFSGDVSPGSTVVMVFTQYGDNSGGPLTTSNPTFGGQPVSNAVKCVTENSPASSSAVATDTWLLPYLPGGSANIGLTYSGTAYDVHVFELGGLGANPQLDAGGGVSGANGSGTAGSSGSAPALQDSPAFIVGSLVQFGVSVMAPGSPWTLVADNAFDACGYQIAAISGGSYAFTGSSGSSGGWAATVTAIVPQPGGSNPGTRQSAVSAAGSLSATFGAGVQEGNSVVIAAAYETSNGAALSLASPTLGGTAFPGATRLLATQSPDTAAVAVAWWLLPDIPSSLAGATTVALTGTATGGTGSAIGLVAWEAGSLGATPVMDRRLAQVGSNSAVGTEGTLPMGGPSGGVAFALAAAQSALTALSSPWTPIQVTGDLLVAGSQAVSGGNTPFLAGAGSASGDWAAGIVAVTPSVPSAAGWRDFTATSPGTFGGVTTYALDSVINGLHQGGGTIKVLPPSAPNLAYPPTIMLALNAGTIDFSGIGIIQSLGLHNAYNVTVVTSAMVTPPAYADNPINPQVQFETFTIQLANWAQATYGSGTTPIYLIGFSKSAFGAHTLIYRNPTVFAKAAGWDFPAMIIDINGDDPTAGQTWPDSLSNFLANYGTDANFQKYRLSAANIATWVAASNFATVKRIWTGGYYMFGADVSAFFGVETGAGVGFDSWYALDSSHDWHADWVEAAFRSLTAVASSPGRGFAAVTQRATSVATVT